MSEHRCRWTFFLIAGIAGWKCAICGRYPTWTELAATLDRAERFGDRFFGRGHR
jgi:hypothetical protein